MAKKPTSVEIPLDYLITTHILLNSAYEELKTKLGEEAALTFFALTADTVPWEGMEEAPNLESLKATMQAYGYNLQSSQKGGTIDIRIQCPHASKIHKHMGQGATFCPMSQVVLSAIRKEHPKSTLGDHVLNSDGSSFEIRVAD